MAARSDSTDHPNDDHHAGSQRRLRLPGVKVLPPPARRLLRKQVLAVLSHDAPAPDYDTPLGDPGLFARTA